MEDGNTKSQVAAKYGIPKNTLSTWLKNKDKIFEATKKGSNSKCHRLRQGTFVNLDQAMFKWLLVVRSRDVVVSALIEFAEKMNVEDFKVSDGWLDRWKKNDLMCHLKRFQVKVMHVQTKWSHLGKKLRYQLSCPNMTSTRSTTSTNLACFIALNQISPYI